jgi:hypothetical protein
MDLMQYKLQSRRDRAVAVAVEVEVVVVVMLVTVVQGAMAEGRNQPPTTTLPQASVAPDCRMCPQSFATH